MVSVCLIFILIYRYNLTFLSLFYINLFIYYTQTGSDRSPDSIRSKIVRIMASYKEATERMAQTGNRMYGLEYTSYQEFIVMISLFTLSIVSIGECKEDECKGSIIDSSLMGN